MIVKYDNKKVRYPIHSIVLSNKGEIRYWFDDNGNIHTAVWKDDACILADNEDRPINDIIKILVKDVAKHAHILNSSLEDKETIKMLKNELGKARRQRNHYSRLLKEKKQLIQELKYEARRWAELYGKAVTGELFE